MKKSDRNCNNCGMILSEDAPNWFQCSEKCRAERWITVGDNPDPDGLRQLYDEQLKLRQVIENWKVFNPVEVDEELIFIERFLVD